MFQKHNTSHISTIWNQGSGIRGTRARTLVHTWYLPHEEQGFNMTWHEGVERWGQNQISEERGVHLLGTEAKFCYKNDKISRPKAYFNHKHSKVCRDRKEKWKMKPEIMIIINLHERWIGQIIWCPIAHAAENLWNGPRGLRLLALLLAALNSFKKYMIHQNQKGKDFYKIDSKFIKWLNKPRKKISVMCSTCGGAICITPCCGKYHTKKNCQTGTQEFSIISVRNSNTSFKKTTIN